MFNTLRTLGILPSPERFRFNFGIGDIVKAFQKSPEQKKAEGMADLDKRRGEAFNRQESGRLEASKLGHENTENSRINRGGMLADALGKFSGDFALSPEQVNSIKNRRFFTDYKREYSPNAVDPEFLKTGFWGKLANVGGGLADAYLGGLTGGVSSLFGKGAGGATDASQAVLDRGDNDPYDPSKNRNYGG